MSNNFKQPLISNFFGNNRKKRNPRKRKKPDQQKEEKRVENQDKISLEFKKEKQTIKKKRNLQEKKEKEKEIIKPKLEFVNETKEQEQESLHENEEELTQQFSSEEEFEDSEEEIPTEEKPKHKFQMYKEKSVKINPQIKTKKTNKSKKEEYHYEDYHPTKQLSVYWKNGQNVPFLFLAKAFQEIEQYSGRIKTTEILGNCFRSILAKSPQSLVQAIYLSCCKISPDYFGIELGIGEQILQKAVSKSIGRNLNFVRKEYDKKGDLGLVVQATRSNQMFLVKPRPLTINDVFTKLHKIAECHGSNSQEKKISMIVSLLVNSRECESKFIIRILQTKLRIGLAETTVLIALGHAFYLNEKYYQKKKNVTRKITSEILDKYGTTVKKNYHKYPNYDKLFELAQKYGIDNLTEKTEFTPGIPVKPMLAKPTTGVKEVLDRLEGYQLICEYKYDGERAQIHFLENGDLKVFSRNSEDITQKYPDLVKFIPNSRKDSVTSFVLDSECVAIDPKTGDLRPFQILSTRAKKDVQIEDISVDVCLFAFDLMYLNGESLLDKPLEYRRKKLYESFNEIENKFTFAKGMQTKDLAEIGDFFKKALAAGTEGLMVKRLDKDAYYQPSKRTFSWLKLKKDYLKELSDTLDLVPIGAYIGRGKRTGGYGGYLLACYDEDNEVYQAICKIGTGFSDENLEKFTKFFESKTISRPLPYYQVSTDLSKQPDIWLEPSVVWEVSAADLSLSPNYYAAYGLAHPKQGISLRFPRFKRVRDDKDPEDATNSDQVLEFFEKQTLHK
ncbi:DNA ligase [Anaeramoeba flamelloides]|uniref:DNA ligase n=1 Tax=Anaeramoeba flamelloides TaxID=1746091 RepID=A0AAV8A2Y3_9EUKA|nr:DNA ligase [Anaeramoeba flamelloides]